MVKTAHSAGIMEQRKQRRELSKSRKKNISKHIKGKLYQIIAKAA